MKKAIALFLALILALGAGLSLAETDVTGVWYADLDGAAAELTLNADGSYLLSVPMEENKTGTWKLDDGYLYMDGSAAPDLATWGENTLILGDYDGVFTREKPWVYDPADLMPDTSADLFEGLWRSAYTENNGVFLPTDYTDDDTLIYIEELKAVLKGGPFGYILADLNFENGAFTYAAGDITAKMQLQQDGFLRLTTEKDGQTETCILVRTGVDKPEDDE